jgi:hypothetical protein
LRDVSVANVASLGAVRFLLWQRCDGVDEAARVI